MISELDNYLQRIENLRGQIGSLIADLPAEALNWRPTDQVEDHATNSMAAMVNHICGAEHFWMAETIGQRPPTRDREAEFVSQVNSASDLAARLEQAALETREIFDGLTPADLDGMRHVQDREVPVRWAMLHVVDHTALHLGHMQITYQLWMGGKGALAPRWFQRLPQEK